MEDDGKVRMLSRCWTTEAEGEQVGKRLEEEDMLQCT